MPKPLTLEDLDRALREHHGLIWQKLEAIEKKIDKVRRLLAR